MTIKFTLEFSLPSWLFSPSMPPAPRGVVEVPASPVEPAASGLAKASPRLALVRTGSAA